MLDIITKSKVRKDILRLLFSREDKSYFLSEIANIVETSPGNTQRELNRLLKAGIINTEKQGNIRYFVLEKSSPVYSEIKKIVKKTIGLETELRQVLKIDGIQFAFIFGSYQKNELKADSDIDICIIGDLDENKLINKINKLEKVIEREINYHLYTLTEFKAGISNNSFLKNITKEYLLLIGDKYEFGNLLKTINKAGAD